MQNYDIQKGNFARDTALKIWNLLLYIQKFILVISSLVIIVGICLMVIFRYILEKNLFGAEEIIVIGAFWLYFIGGTYGTYDRSHISADFISSYLKSKKAKSLIKIITTFITLLICVLYSYWAIQFFQWTLDSGAKSTALKIPIIFSKSAITIGFILMTFYQFVYFVKDIIDYLNIIRR